MLRIILFSGFILSLTTATAQVPFNPQQHTPASPLLIQNFLGSRCLDTNSWQQPFLFPQMIRLSLEDLYTAGTKPPKAAGTKLQLGTPNLQSQLGTPNKNTYPFAVFFSSSEDAPLYLIFKGFCRGHHISIPITWSGHYYIAILDQQKPSLFTINTTNSPVIIQYRKACALDLSTPIHKKTQSLPGSRPFFGRRVNGGEEVLEGFGLRFFRGLRFIAGEEQAVNGNGGHWSSASPHSNGREKENKEMAAGKHPPQQEPLSAAIPPKAKPQEAITQPSKPAGLIHFSREATENPLKTKHCMSQPHTKPEKQQPCNPNSISRKPTPKASLFGLGFSVASSR